MLCSARAKSKPVIISVALVAVFWILWSGTIVLAFGQSKLEESRLLAQELGAIVNVRSINAAQVQYYLQFDRYASSLLELGPPSSEGKAGPSAAGLIPADLAAGSKGGYTYALHGKAKGYMLNANPVKYGSTGRRTFFSDESQVIRARPGPEPATVESDEVK